MKKYHLYRWLLFVLILLTSKIYAQQPPEVFKNPILSGFYPDPSICRVDDTYYMVNSSFEWYPGLPIHKSKDLVNWEKIGHGLCRPDQIKYKDGLNNSAGIFAPTIRYHKGTFYIITTMVGQQGNFIITAKNPEGPWSAPMWIKDAPGIDPSLFWDDDGRCYYTGAGIIDGTKKEWPGKNGVWMQEIDPDTGVLLGEKKQLTYGHASNARWAEGPHIYKINNEYLLLIGEGGTGEFHAVTVFNSKKLWGPYIPNHTNPVMTHRHLAKTYPIIQTGHADLVQTQNGNWWSVMLAKRLTKNYVTLARETFLAKVIMTQQESGVTPIFNPGIGLLQLEQKRPNLPWTPVPKLKERDEFQNKTLGLEWNFLRSPREQWYTLKDGELEIKLRPETVNELVNPSYIAQRTRNFSYQSTTKLSFKTKKENEKAGLAIYRKTGNNYQLLKTKDKIVLIKTYQKVLNGFFEPELIASIPYSKNNVVLGAKVDELDVQFLYGENETDLKPIGAIQDYTIVSDEVAQKYNGVYVGMYATSSGKTSKKSAKFEWFDYKPSN
ncbi:glycoside hydrolase family 43 protein [Tamlana sp. 2_MG-2023]|uniref:glycoside hydrolase family 43 protein n=1 Tax=unclassified Tamlana TaxID=2614803 RepID=UPI0026E29257|nr:MULTISPECIES: glycoside hydrolase family 43 protein [unclassified Tamlana]MDO6760464.1 glycoside hydrolase family 43 protein [Tamlana sp. 2_MG-2023]MDO6790720.1 glycoside hydrolase family 43 protein [Tamlana sp. 1_MG-2023]